MSKDRVYKDAPPKEHSLKLPVWRAKGKYWVEECRAEITEFMDIGMLPDYELHINFSTGGKKRLSNFRIDIDKTDFPAVLELMYNIGGKKFRECLRLMALRSIAEHPRDMEHQYHRVKNETAKAKEQTGDNGTETAKAEDIDGHRGPTAATE